MKRESNPKCTIKRTQNQFGVNEPKTKHKAQIAFKPVEARIVHTPPEDI
jgi:hypothetical protein